MDWDFCPRYMGDDDDDDFDDFSHARRTAVQVLPVGSPLPAAAAAGRTVSISLSVKDSALHNKLSRCAAEHTSRGAAHLAAGCAAAIESIFQRAVEDYIKSRTPSPSALSADILGHMAERLRVSQVAWLAQRRTREACDESLANINSCRLQLEHVTLRCEVRRRAGCPPPPFRGGARSSQARGGRGA